MARSETPHAVTIAAELEQLTVTEAIAMAAAFEAAAVAFYLDLAERVPPEVRPLALELMGEEQKHQRLLDDLATDPRLKDDLHQRFPAPISTPAFHSFITVLELGEAPQEDELLAYAEAREAIAREHYGYLAELAPPGSVRELFAFLQLQEQAHVDHLATRWTEVFSVP